LSNATNGHIVRQFEQAFAKYVGAKYAIACCNGTATLHTALVALGVKPGDRVAVPPLTMASTTLAVLHAGAVPRFVDVDERTWLMHSPFSGWSIPVCLYGMDKECNARDGVQDAAQTLNKASGAFTSYSFQASKILSAGEGGMLVTDDDALAFSAEMIRDLGYPKEARQKLKQPDAIRHVRMGYNYRMADCQAALLLPQLERADTILEERAYSAQCYRQAISGCDWITPQYVPDGWPHSYWTYAIALRDKEMWGPFVQAIEAAGGERPYAAWRLTYQEPAFRHLAPDGTCPVAEDLQPRLVQLQTNHTKARAEGAADALHQAIGEVGG
jgi:perosamine synthetase